MNPFARFWSLDPEVVFLNHGSFGACPLRILERQQELRAEMEREPVEFLYRRYEGRIDEAREALGRFTGADADDLAFVPNATTGVNTVLRSLAFEPGDELLVTDHEYNACRNVLNFVAERWRAKVVVASVPFPSSSETEVVDRVLSAVTGRTKLLLIDHVTSATGVIFPLDPLVRPLAEGSTLWSMGRTRGNASAHLEEPGATGNCHKWMCTRGSAFLHVRRDRQHWFVRSPSAGANSPRTTGAASPELTSAEPTTHAVSPFPKDRLSRRFCPVVDEVHSRTALSPFAAQCSGFIPVAPEMLGCSPPFLFRSPRRIELPPMSVDPISKELFEKHRIETRLRLAALAKRLLRVSAQLYNDESSSGRSRAPSARPFQRKGRLRRRYRSIAVSSSAVLPSAA
jgi:isopenicillin-N epimerase